VYAALTVVLATKVALAPLSSVTEEGAGLAALEKTLATGMVGLKDVVVIRAAEVKATLKKAKRRDLEACEGETPCLQEVGRLVGADLVVSGVAHRLVEGDVVYLKTVDVKTGSETGSTTVTLSGPEPARAAQARAAAYRLAAPGAYLGTLLLQVEVEGAQVFVDGKNVGKAPIGPIALAVGTHALRVTHPRYRDFVRFVEIDFDKTTPLRVGLKEFAAITDDMRGRPIPEEHRPWYQTGWAFAGFGAVIAVVATVVVISLGKGPERDADATVHPPR
jgi:PEGA domain